MPPVKKPSPPIKAVKAPARAPLAPAKPVEAAPKYATLPAPKRQDIGTEFYDFELENAFGFKGRHVIPMKDLGLINVLGRNQETAEESSSGAGKSRAFRLFVYLQYGSKALGTNESVSDLRLFGSNFMLALRLRRHNRFFKLRETYKYGKEPSGLALFEYPEGFDGPAEPIGPVNDPTALRAFYQNLISLTYDEFIGTVILPQRFGHTLIRGKPAARIQWLSDLYGLTAYADMYKSLSETLDSIRSQISRLLEVRGRYNVIADDLAQMSSETNIEDLQEKLDKLRDDVTGLEKSIETAKSKLSTTQRRLDSLQQLKYGIESAEAQDLDGVERGKAVAGTLLSEFEAQAASVREDLTALRRIVSLQDQLARVQSYIDATGVVVLSDEERAEYEVLTTQTLPQLRAAAAKSRDDSAGLNRQMADLQTRINSTAAAAGFRVLEPNQLRETVTTARAGVATAQGACANYNASLSKINAALRVSSGCECPTCMQNVENHELLESYKADLVAKLAEERSNGEVHTRTLNAAEDILRGLQSVTDLRTRLAPSLEAENARRDLGPATARYNELTTLLRDADRVQKLVGQQETLIGQLGDHVSADVSHEITDLDAAVATHAATRGRYRNAENAYNAVYSMAEGLGIEDPFAVDLAGELQGLVQNRDRNQDWLTKASAKRDNARLQIERWRSILATHKQKSTQLAQLSTQLQRLEALEDDEIVLAATKKAYDKSGMKVDRLKSLLGKIKEGLPTWTRILFTEPYFDVKVDSEDSKSLSLLVTKRHVVDGKEKISWIDASELSGGEESRFALCVMLTLMSQVAPEKRTNVLIVDEADAGLDDLGKRLMAELLLPMMRAEKPTMFVITHQLQIEHGVIDGNLVVTKSPEGVSRVELVASRV